MYILRLVVCYGLIMHLKKYYRVRTADATTFFLRLLTSVRSKKVKYESVLNTPCIMHVRSRKPTSRLLLACRYNRCHSSDLTSNLDEKFSSWLKCWHRYAVRNN